MLILLINTTPVYNWSISTYCIPNFNSEIDCRFSMCWEKNVPMTIYLCVYHVNFTCFINRMRKRLGRNFVSNIDCEVTCNWIVWLDKRLSGSRTAVPKNVFVLISITLNLSTYLSKALSVIFLETKENATIVQSVIWTEIAFLDCYLKSSEKPKLKFNEIFPEFFISPIRSLIFFCHQIFIFVLICANNETS